MSNQSYTIADLLAMHDERLNALAAELRGYKLVETVPFNEWQKGGAKWDSAYENGSGDSIPVTEWTPATDRNQSGELLMWAIEQGCQFDISLAAESEIDFCARGWGWSTVSVDSGLLRAETVAFCAAMLAMAGRLQ